MKNYCGISGRFFNALGQSKVNIATSLAQNRLSTSFRHHFQSFSGSFSGRRYRGGYCTRLVRAEYQRGGEQKELSLALKAGGEVSRCRTLCLHLVLIITNTPFLL